MDNAEKARENRARRMLERRGFRLSKSRLRDPGAIGYGMYYILSADEMRDHSAREFAAMRSLDDVEQWIRERDDRATRA